MKKILNTKVKDMKAITLIALVITIVVLIILASVAISLSLGENGLFKKAQTAKESYLTSANEEQVALANYESLINGTRNIDKTELTKLLKEIIKDEKIDTTPAGTVISYIVNSEPPTGYLKCDGTVYNISEYQELADKIKEGFGKYDYWGGNGETTFAVPNLQGEFLRGTGNNADTTQGNGGTVGEHQKATISSNAYGNKVNTNLKITRSEKNAENTDSIIESNLHMLYVSGGDTTGGFTYTSRPTNTSVLYCIKY